MLARRLTPAIMCLFVALTSLAAMPLLARNALIGKWNATLAAEDGKETNDVISFKGGMFTSENQVKEGFTPAAYDDNPAPFGMSSKFSVTLTNPAGDTAAWSGFSTGNQIDGTLVLTRKKAAAINFTFKASKQ